MLKFFHHNKKAEVLHESDEELLQERKSEVLPWIGNPLEHAHGEDFTFHVRHEANTVELFFDLFFVANLATFTAYHSITDLDSLIAYIGLFGVIWATWFSVTLFDVRFAIDSVWERICKIIQFIVFVGFALVGSSFAPGTKKENNVNFRILCFCIFISRGLLAIQYGIMLVFSWQSSYRKKLVVPLSLNVLVLLLSGGVSLAMTPAFNATTGNSVKIYYIWYITLFLECAFTIGCSSIWRILSFKKTHLAERMSLLTLIVIGEGAIGVTKTIGKMMGEYGLNFEGCAQVFCIILVLVFLWMLYFDNHPHGHYGTIREQVWAALHFPLHLSIVGTVEGSQQIALARYVYKNVAKLRGSIVSYCYQQHLSGTSLATKLNSTIDYFKLYDKVEAKDQLKVIYSDLYTIANQSSLCSAANKTLTAADAFFPSLETLTSDTLGGLFQANGAKLPKDKAPTDLAKDSFFIIYCYFWASLITVLLCSMTFLWLTRRHQHRLDIFDHMAMGIRAVAVLLAGGLLAIAANDVTVNDYIKSPAILPTLVGILFIIICSDRIARLLAQARLVKRVGLEAGHGRTDIVHTKDSDEMMINVQEVELAEVKHHAV